MATEIDFRETYLAGSRALVDRVLAEERLEALSIHSRDHVPFRGPPEWLLEAVESAVIELLERGEARITTPCGSVCARLESSENGSHRRLLVNGVDASGDVLGGESTLEAADEAQLREWSVSELSNALVELVC